jgi:hypothetical protein
MVPRGVGLSAACAVVVMSVIVAVPYKSGVRFAAGVEVGIVWKRIHRLGRRCWRRRSSLALREHRPATGELGLGFRGLALESGALGSELGLAGLDFRGCLL